MKGQELAGVIATAHYNTSNMKLLLRCMLPFSCVALTPVLIVHNIAEENTKARIRRAECHHMLSILRIYPSWEYSFIYMNASTIAFTSSVYILIRSRQVYKSRWIFEANLPDISMILLLDLQPPFPFVECRRRVYIS